MKTLTENQIYEQDSLTKDRLDKFLTPKEPFRPKRSRPESSLIDLINWVTTEVYGCPQIYGSYIHNKIVVDGSFLQFCEENNVEVECILKDSIASWNTEHDTENFIAQGIFKIKKDNFDFLHCALFHKGNQNEDEVSFFVIVHNDCYDDYIKFRNEYEKWQSERERSTPEIYVAGGEPITYESNLTWDDVILPKSVEDEIKRSVDGFLNAESFYKENDIPWKRSIIFFGEPGQGKTHTVKILLSQYGFKPVTIQAGHPQTDQLLEEAFEYASSHGPSLLYLEDLPEMLNTISESLFLQLLDGVSTYEGLLIVATANDLKDVPSNLTDRPSRFDRKIHFPAPDKEMALKFLKLKFKNLLKETEYNKVAKECVKNNFSFAYLKELYVTSAHIAISNNRSKPNYNDVEEALKCLSKDKTYVKTGFGLSTSKSIDMASLFDQDQEYE